MARKRCINCKQFQRKSLTGFIGMCRKYGFSVKDTLSGCEIILPDNVPGMVVEPMQLPEVIIPKDFNI